MKTLDLKIKIDTETATVSVENLTEAVEDLGEKTKKSAKDAEKSTGAFRKLGDGIKALAGATIVLKAFDIAVDTFKNLDAVARAVEKSMAAVKAAFFTLAPIVENFGKAALALVTGEFEDAGKFAGIMVSQLKKSVDTFQELNDQAQNTVDLFRELRDAERELNVATAERQALIEKNKYLSDDETKSIEDRIKAAKIAFDLESQIANERIKLEERRLELIKADPTRDPKAESTLNEIATARIAIFQAQNDQISRQTELNNKINQLNREQLLLLSDNGEEEEEMLDAKEAANDAFFTKIREQNKQRVKDNELFNQEMIDSNNEFHENNLKNLAEEEAKKEAQRIKDQKNISDSIKSSYEASQVIQGFGDLAFANKLKNAEKGSKYEEELLKKQWQFNKKLQLAASVIDGAKAINASLAQSPVAIGPVPNPAGIASLALAATTTALNIAKIASTTYQSQAAANAPNFSVPSFEPSQQTVNVGNVNQFNQQPVQAYITATDVSNALEARKMLQNKNTL